MSFSTLTALLATLVVASARDSNKFMKTVPTISNSLVNLGKMEISFHFNGKHNEAPSSDNNPHNDYYPQQAVEDSCPCNNFKPPSFLSDPTEIVNKILKSNDFFRDPTSSICCESAEHVQESSVVFEMNPSNLLNIPNFSTPKQPNSYPILPNALRSPIFPSFLPLNSIGSKPKTVEIFMFPTKKNDMSFDFGNFLKPRKTKDITITKSDLQVIKEGTKQPSASVKKDLNVLQKKNLETIEETKDEGHTEAPRVSNVVNSL